VPDPGATATATLKFHLLLKNPENPQKTTVASHFLAFFSSFVLFMMNYPTGIV
jgi:hypothetical protein